MKGIVLAGGLGTRLHPLTRAVSKQLLPVFDKPMIYYPIATLMLAGIRELCVISTPRDLPLYRDLLGDGSALGISLSFVEQPRPAGLPEAFTLGASFIGTDPVALALGDNIFLGDGIATVARRAATPSANATILACEVDDPSGFAVVDLDANHRALHIEEKPAAPRSRYAVPGLYFYPNDVVGLSRTLRPSARGELEIADINNAFLREGRLRVEVLDASVRWVDAGTAERLLEAAVAVRDAQTGAELVGSIEAVALRMGYISADDLQRLALARGQNAYAASLLAIANAADGRDPSRLRSDAAS